MPDETATDAATFTSERPFVIAAAATTLPVAAATLASGFARDRAIVCRDVIDPALLARLRAQCDDSPFVSDPVPGIGLREIEAKPQVAATFCLLLQRPNFLRWLERVTGVEPLGIVKGAIGQTRPTAGFGLGWHDDIQVGEESRRLAITIDLSGAPFEGGIFELRRRSDGHVLRFRHDTPGSAMIFAVDAALEHRLLPITAGGPRRVFAGWFHAKAAPA